MADGKYIAIHYYTTLYYLRYTTYATISPYVFAHQWAGEEVVLVVLVVGE